MSMSPRAQVTYNAVLRRAVIENGALVSTGSHQWSYLADDWEALHECRKNCRVYSDDVVNESEWREFAGTFASHDNYKRGLDLTGVNCNCGRIVNRTIRWDVSPSEAIEKVFEIAFGEENE